MPVYLVNNILGHMWQQMFKQVFPYNRGIKKQYVLAEILSCILNPRILIPFHSRVNQNNSADVKGVTLG